MTSQRVRLFFAVSLFAILLPVSATADVINPDEVICETKEVGDKCNLEGGGSGSCVAATCSRLDYSNGTPPTTVEYECKRCEPGGPMDDASGCSVSSVAGGTPLTAVSFFLGACLFGGLLRRRRTR